jgi:hypothetical protein
VAAFPFAVAAVVIARFFFVFGLIVVFAGRRVVIAAG